MTVSIFQVAKKVCILSNWSLSNLEVQRISYLISMCYAGQYKNSLIKENFEAWDYGPIEPNLYSYLQVFGNKKIYGFFNSTELIQDKEILDFIEKIYKSLEKFNTVQILHITRLKHSAWYKVYSPKNRKIMTSDLLCYEYEQRKRNIVHN